MIRYDSKDLFSDLGKLVEQDVKHYQSDFTIDKEILLESFERGEQDFIWWTRENGTGCIREREAFLKETSARNSCLYWLTGDETVKAYTVNVRGTVNGQMIGSIYPMDTKELADQIEKESVPVASVTIVPEQGESVLVDYQEFNKACLSYGDKYGKYSLLYHPSEENQSKLSAILQGNKTKRAKAACYDVVGLFQGGSKKTGLDAKIRDATKACEDVSKGKGVKKMEKGLEL